MSVGGLGQRRTDDLSEGFAMREAGKHDRAPEGAAAFLRTSVIDMSTIQPRIRGEAPPPRHRAILLRHVEEEGEHTIADAIGISRGGLSRVLAGLPLYPSTRNAVTRYLVRIGEIDE